MNHTSHTVLLKVHLQIALLWRFIRIIHTSEPLDLSSSRPCIHTPFVRLLAILQACGHVHKIERSMLRHRLPRARPTGLERGNRCANDGRARLGQLGRHERYALDIPMPILPRKPQLRRQARTHRLAQQQRHRPSPLLMQRHIQRPRHGIFAAVLVPCQENGEPLLEPRRMTLPQHPHHLRVREPLRDILAGPQPTPQLRPRNIQRPHPLFHLVVGPILITIRQINHLLERHDLDPQLLPILLHRVLRIVRAVEILPAAVLAGARVVPPDDEMRGTVVLADDGMPNGLPGPTHPHRQRQQAQHGHPVGVPRQQGLINAHPREMIDVARFGQPDDGVDQHVGLAGARGADGEFAVGPVHRVARLEGDHPGPAEFFEVDAQLGGGVAQGHVVVVVESRDGLDGAADVVGARGGVEVFDGGVLGVAAEDLLAFFFSGGSWPWVRGGMSRGPTKGEMGGERGHGAFYLSGL